MPASRTGPERVDRERQRRCGGVGRACRQYGRHAGAYPGNPLFCRGRAGHRRSRQAIAPRSCDQPDPAAAPSPSQLSTWPDGKTITESKRVLAYLCKNIRLIGDLARSSNASTDVRRARSACRLPAPWGCGASCDAERYGRMISDTCWTIDRVLNRGSGRLRAAGQRARDVVVVTQLRRTLRNGGAGWLNPLTRSPWRIARRGCAAHQRALNIVNVALSGSALSTCPRSLRARRPARASRAVR